MTSRTYKYGDIETSMRETAYRERCAAREGFVRAVRHHDESEHGPCAFAAQATLVRDVTDVCWAAACSVFGDKATPGLAVQMASLVLERCDGTPPARDHLRGER